MKFFIIAFNLLCSFLINAQVVNNGDFVSATAGWGCNPETNPENVYGGGTSNSVAEVDAAAGLCQTIGGFTIGSVYTLSIDYSRRTGGCPGPNPAGATITISNSALTAGISSNVASYALQTSVFTFTATQTSLTLNIAANFTGTTCGLIIDNIVLSLYSGLPIELLYFKATGNSKTVLCEWAVATQLNNDFFTVERSADAINWYRLQQVKGDGTLLQIKQFSITDTEPLNGVSYYRLKQTDYNKTFVYSPIVSLEKNPGKLLIYPNPAKDEVFIIIENRGIDISVINTTGNEFKMEHTQQDNSRVGINTSQLAAGIYTLKLVAGGKTYYKRIIIEKNK